MNDIADADDSRERSKPWISCCACRRHEAAGSPGDFGKSRWQLSDKVTPLQRVVEEAGMASAVRVHPGAMGRLLLAPAGSAGRRQESPVIGLERKTFARSEDFRV